MFCPQCGSQAPSAEAAFCGSCGATLNRALQPLAAPAPAAALATDLLIPPHPPVFAPQQAHREQAPPAPVLPPASGPVGPPPTPAWLKNAGLSALEWGSAARVAALSLVPVIVLVTVIIGVALTFAVDDSASRGSFVDWIRLGVASVCVAFGATIKVSGNAGDLASGSLTVHGVPLLVTAAVVALFVWWSRRDEAAQNSRGRSHLIARSLAAAGIAAVTLTIVQAIFGLPGGYGKVADVGDVADISDLANVGVSISPLLTGFVMLLVLGSVGAFARAAMYGRRTGQSALEVLTPQAGRVAEMLDLSRTWLVAMGAFSLPAVLILIVLADTNGFWIAAGVFATAIGQLLAAVGTLGMFGGLSAHGEGGLFGFSDGATNTFTLFSDGVSWGYKLLLLIPVAATVVTGVRFALRRAPQLDPLRAWWMTTGAVTLASLVAGFVTRLSGGAKGEGSGFGGSAGYGLGADIARLFLVALVWGALVAVAARFVTPVLSGSAPRSARWLAGRGLHPAWAPHLGVAPTRPPVPAGLAPAATNIPGAPAGAFGGTDIVPVLQPVQLSRRTKVLIGVVGGGSALVIAVLALGVKVAESTVYSPGKPVKSYLEDVAAGRVSDAVKTAHIKGDIAQGVLKDPENRIHDVQVGDIETDGDYATVKVSYSLGGDNVHTSYSLVRDGSVLGVVAKWKLTVDPDTLTLSGPETADLRVNGSAAGETFAVLPGRYQVTGLSAMLAVSSETVRADDSGIETPVELTGEVNAATISAVQQAVQDQLESCAATATDLEPAGCPFSHYEYADSAQVAWTITAVPTVTVEFDGTDLTFSSDYDAGTAHVKGTATDAYFGDSKIDADESFSVSGSATITADSAVVNFDGS